MPEESGAGGVPVVLAGSGAAGGGAGGGEEGGAFAWSWVSTWDGSLRGLRRVERGGHAAQVRLWIQAR
jgi:hypothetical protein